LRKTRRKILRRILKRTLRKSHRRLLDRIQWKRILYLNLQGEGKETLRRIVPSSNVLGGGIVGESDHKMYILTLDSHHRR
jgi:hypothetical protein